MALQDIFLFIFDGYGTGGIGFMALIIFPIFYSAFQSFRTLLKRLKPRNETIDALIYTPPYIIFFMAAFLGFCLNLMIFSSYKSPWEMILTAERAYGVQLHVEVIAVVVVMLALTLFYAQMARRYLDQREPLWNFSDKIELVVSVALIVTALFSIVTGGLAQHRLPEVVNGLYLYCAFSAAIKALLLLFDIIWSFLCSDTASEDIGFGGNPLDRLLDKVQKANYKNALISLLAGMFLVCCLLVGVTRETRSYTISGDEDNLSQHSGEFVSIKNPDLRLLTDDYQMPKKYTAQGTLVSSGEAAYLWYAAPPHKPGFYIVAGDKEHALFSKGGVTTLTGMLHHLTESMDREMRSAAAAAMLTDAPDFYIDSTVQPNYSLYRWVIFVSAVPLVYIFFFLYAALFPAKSRLVRSLYLQYPNLDQIVQSGFRGVDAKDNAGSPVYFTENHILWEHPKTLEIKALSWIVSAETQASPDQYLTVIEFIDGHRRALIFSSQSDQDAFRYAIGARPPHR